MSAANQSARTAEHAASKRLSSSIVLNKRWTTISKACAVLAAFVIAGGCLTTIDLSSSLTPFALAKGKGGGDHGGGNGGGKKGGGDGGGNKGGGDGGGKKGGSDGGGNKGGGDGGGKKGGGDGGGKKGGGDGGGKKGGGNGGGKKGGGNGGGKKGGGNGGSKKGDDQSGEVAPVSTSGSSGSSGSGSGATTITAVIASALTGASTAAPAASPVQTLSTTISLASLTTEATVTAALPTTVSTSNGGFSRDQYNGFRHDELLAFKPSAQILTMLVAQGYTINGAIPLNDLQDAVYRLGMPPGMDAVSARAALAKAGHPDIFGFNQYYRLFQPADANQQTAPGVSAPSNGRAIAQRCSGDHCFNRVAMAWSDSLSACAEGVKIGILDTGADYRHPVFAGRLQPNANYHQANFVAIGKAKAPTDHATSVIALLAGDESGGTPGLLPRANYFDAGVFALDADKQPIADTFSLVAGLEWLGGQKVSIINMSFSGPPDPIVAESLSRLSRQGVVLVAAAGNEGPLAPPSYPAAYPEVISVTAIGKDLRQYRHANRGSYIDIAAPGVGIWTAIGNAKAGYRSGTSFAVPHVTAVLAMQAREPGPVNKSSVLRRLRVADLGQPGPDPVYGRGLLLAPENCQPTGTPASEGDLVAAQTLPSLAPSSPAPVNSDVVATATVQTVSQTATQLTPPTFSVQSGSADADLWKPVIVK
jgi:Subtilase family